MKPQQLAPLPLEGCVGGLTPLEVPIRERLDARGEVCEWRERAREPLVAASALLEQMAECVVMLDVPRWGCA